jgi:V/A-type H+-transporting ATPase subunit I
MAKFMIVSHRGEAADLLESLQSEGICQILNAESATAGKELKAPAKGLDKPRDIEELLGKLTRAISFLKPLSKKTGGIAAMLAPKIVVDKATYQKVTSDDSLFAVVEQCIETHSTIEKLETEIETLTTRLEELRPWEGLEAAIEEFGRLKQVKCWIGFVPNNRLEQLQETLLEPGAILDKVAESANKNACVIIALNEQAEEIQKLLRGAEFEQANFAGVTGTVSEAIIQITEKLETAKQQLGEQNEMAKSLAEHTVELEILHDHYSNLLNREKTKETSPATEQTVIYEGWVKQKDFKRLEKIVSRFRASSIQKIEPAEGEEIPVEIENKSIVRPFEVITRLYGMPQCVEVDPTVFLMPFFALFFGICVGDAGYGLVMIAVMALFIKKMQGDKKLLWMLGICSGAAVVVGTLTGSWFGDAVQQFVPALVPLKDKVTILNPLEQPEKLLVLALILGYVQIMAGLLIAFGHNLRRRDFVAAICNQLTWLVMLNSIVLFGLSRSGVVPASVGNFCGRIAPVPAVVIFLFSNRQGSWAARLGMGFYNLFSSVFYMGDVLSYLRLMGLCMVGAGMAMAINLIAKIALGLPFGLGVIAAIAVLVAGHGFNLVLSALGAFVHTLRLQYVEFFPKFFAGGGKAFEPLHREYKHIYLKD